MYVCPYNRCIQISSPASNTDQVRFPVADVLWTFALDTYLVVFHHFDTQSLRKLEIKYTAVITTLSFIPAFVFLFIRGHEKGPIYGDETVSYCDGLGIVS